MAAFDFSPIAPLRNFSSHEPFTHLYFCPSTFSCTQTLCAPLFTSSVPLSPPHSPSFWPLVSSLSMPGCRCCSCPTCSPSLPSVFHPHSTFKSQPFRSPHLFLHFPLCLFLIPSFCLSNTSVPPHTVYQPNTHINTHNTCAHYLVLSPQGFPVFISVCNRTKCSSLLWEKKKHHICACREGKHHLWRREQKYWLS